MNGRRCATRLSIPLAVMFLFGACVTMPRHGVETFGRYLPAGGGVAPSTEGWGEPSTVGVATGTATAAALVSSEHRLQTGDRVTISLRGIPSPSEIEDQIDEKGSVNLELLGVVAIGGLTTSEAERKIEHAYVASEIYQRINVTIVTERGEYFVRGEVRQPGRFPLPSGITLTEAIAAAGGYTDYARPTRVRIIRGAQVILADATRIEKRLDPDVIIKRNDTIVVERSPI